MIKIDDPDYNSDNPELTQSVIEPRELAEGEKLESAEIPELTLTQALPGLTEGRMVHFVLPNGDHRAAIVVNAWNGGIGSDHLANLDVHTDYSNDLGAYPLDASKGVTEDFRNQVRHGHFWATSVPFDEVTKRPFSWHWIEPK